MLICNTNNPNSKPRQLLLIKMKTENSASSESVPSIRNSEIVKLLPCPRSVINTNNQNGDLKILMPNKVNINNSGLVKLLPHVPANNTNVPNVDLGKVLPNKTDIQNSEFVKILPLLRYIINSDIPSPESSKVIPSKTNVQNSELVKLIPFQGSIVNTNIQKGELKKALPCQKYIRKSELEKLLPSNESTINMDIQKAELVKALLNESYIRKSELAKILPDNESNINKNDTKPKVMKLLPVNEPTINTDIQKAEFLKLLNESYIRKSELDTLLPDNQFNINKNIPNLILKVLPIVKTRKSAIIKSLPRDEPIHMNISKANLRKSLPSKMNNIHLNKLLPRHSSNINKNIPKTALKKVSVRDQSTSTNFSNSEPTNNDPVLIPSLHPEVVEDSVGLKKPKKKQDTISDEKRKMVINYFNVTKNPNMKETAQIFQIKLRTLYRIRMNYRNNNIITKKPREGVRATKMKDEDINFIRGEMDQNRTMTLRNIKQKLMSDRKLNVSVTTISRQCHKLKYYKKKSSKAVQKSTLVDVEVERKSYCTLFKRIYRERHIIFCDEAIFHVSSLCDNGRSVNGAQASGKLPRKASKLLSVIASICSDGFIIFRVEDKPANRPLFLDYLGSLCDILNEVNIINAYIIMDTVPFHKCFEVKQLIEEKGHELLFIPPHSLFLNPFEKIFPEWKSYVKVNNPVDEDEIKQFITQFNDTFTEEQINNYFIDMLHIVNNYLSGVPIHLCNK